MSEPRNPLPPKRSVCMTLLKDPSVFVHLDPRRQGVVVPPWFKRQPQLVLQIGLNMPTPIDDLEIADDAITCTLSFSRSPFTCYLPWEAIYALVGEDGRFMVWPSDVPPEVAAQMQQKIQQSAPSLVVARDPASKSVGMREVPKATGKDSKDSKSKAKKAKRERPKLTAVPAPAPSGKVESETPRPPSQPGPPVVVVPEPVATPAATSTPSSAPTPAPALTAVPSPALTAVPSPASAPAPALAPVPMAPVLAPAPALAEVPDAAAGSPGPSGSPDSPASLEATPSDDRESGASESEDDTDNMPVPAARPAARPGARPAAASRSKRELPPYLRVIK